MSLPYVSMNLTTLGPLCQWAVSYGICASNWFISLSIMSSRFIHVIACVRISWLVLAWWYSVVCETTSRLSVYPSLHGWTLELLPAFGRCKECCCEQVCRVYLWGSAFSSCGYLTSTALAGSYGNSVFHFSRAALPFSQHLRHFTFPEAVPKHSNSSISLPTLDVF